MRLEPQERGCALPWETPEAPCAPCRVWTQPEGSHLYPGLNPRLGLDFGLQDHEK